LNPLWIPSVLIKPNTPPIFVISNGQTQKPSNSFILFKFQNYSWVWFQESSEPWKFALVISKRISIPSIEKTLNSLYAFNFKCVTLKFHYFYPSFILLIWSWLPFVILSIILILVGLQKHSMIVKWTLYMSI